MWIMVRGELHCEQVLVHVRMGEECMASTDAKEIVVNFSVVWEERGCQWNGFK